MGDRGTLIEAGSRRWHEVLRCLQRKTGPQANLEVALEATEMVRRLGRKDEVKPRVLAVCQRESQLLLVVIKIADDKTLTVRREYPLFTDSTLGEDEADAAAVRVDAHAEEEEGRFVLGSERLRVALLDRVRACFVGEREG
eukprot:Hpha_TRINITY_DN24045_c0_g1::TRINITY_DN24045_c0_g1_i1::g.130375::m.130375